MLKCFENLEKLACAWGLFQADETTKRKNLARQLRVLDDDQKRACLNWLDHLSEEYHKRGVLLDSSEALAAYMYTLIEGDTITEPEPEVSRTRKGEKAQKKFQTICGGVKAYIKASKEEQQAFSNSVLKAANPVAKGLYILKMRQKDLF